MKKHLSASLILSGGSQQDAVMAFVEFFPKENRYFLSALKSTKDLKVKDSDEFIVKELEHKDLESVFINIPLSKNLADQCYYRCKNDDFCCDKKFEELNQIKEELRQRASKSLAKKLKKGFSPYSQRDIDLWLLSEYHDELMLYFKSSWDVYSRHDSIVFSRLRYLYRDLPKEKMFESHYLICLIEMKKKGIIGNRHLLDLAHSSTAHIARSYILKELEKKHNLFVYKNDFDILIRRPKAFMALILAFCAQWNIKGEVRQKADWVEDKFFRIPQF